MDLSQEILSEVTVHMKYARYLPEEQRRETWEELITRNKNMHLTNFPKLQSEIEKAYQLVYDKKVLPSMRSLQFAGPAISQTPTRIYNCAYLPIDDYRAFSEVMFLLLGGTGAVSYTHLTLPTLRRVFYLVLDGSNMVKVSIFHRFLQLPNS